MPGAASGRSAKAFNIIFSHNQSMSNISNTLMGYSRSQSINLAIVGRHVLTPAGKVLGGPA